MSWKRFKSPWHQMREERLSQIGYRRLPLAGKRKYIERKKLATPEDLSEWRSMLTASQIQQSAFLRGHCGMAQRIRWGANSTIPFRGRKERVTLQDKRLGHQAPAWRMAVL